MKGEGVRGEGTSYTSSLTECVWQGRGKKGEDVHDPSLLSSNTDGHELTSTLWGCGRGGGGTGEHPCPSLPQHHLLQG